MIHEMNHISMQATTQDTVTLLSTYLTRSKVIDLSHTSEAVMLAVLKMSAVPVIFSHSSA